MSGCERLSPSVFLCPSGAGVIGGRRFPRVALRPAGSGLGCTLGYRPRPRWGRGDRCRIWDVGCRMWATGKERWGDSGFGLRGGWVRGRAVTCLARGQAVLSPHFPRAGRRGAAERVGRRGCGLETARWWPHACAWGSLRFFPRVALRSAGAGLGCTRGYRPRPRWGWGGARFSGAGVPDMVRPARSRSRTGRWLDHPGCAPVSRCFERENGIASVLGPHSVSLNVPDAGGAALTARGWGRRGGDGGAAPKSPPNKRF